MVNWYVLGVDLKHVLSLIISLGVWEFVPGYFSGMKYRRIDAVAVFSICIGQSETSSTCEFQNCWFWNGLPEMVLSNSIPKAGSVGAGCSGPCPVKFWMLSKTDRLQPFWGTCVSAWPPPLSKYFLMFKWFWYFNLCLWPLVHLLDATEKSGFIFFYTLSSGIYAH